MSHENSRTIEQDGRFYNVAFRPAAVAAGGAIGGARGGAEVLRPIFPWEREWYPTLKMAVDAARLRSEAIGMIEEALAKILRRRVIVQ